MLAASQRRYLCGTLKKSCSFLWMIRNLGVFISVAREVEKRDCVFMESVPDSTWLPLNSHISQTFQWFLIHFAYYHTYLYMLFLFSFHVCMSEVCLHVSVCSATVHVWKLENSVQLWSFPSHLVWYSVCAPVSARPPGLQASRDPLSPPPIFWEGGVGTTYGYT